LEKGIDLSEKGIDLLGKGIDLFCLCESLGIPILNSPIKFAFHL
jgi:hypothetical protein